MDESPSCRNQRLELYVVTPGAPDKSKFFLKKRILIFSKFIFFLDLMFHFFFDGCKLSYCAEDVGVYPSAGIPVTSKTSKSIPCCTFLSS